MNKPTSQPESAKERILALTEFSIDDLSTEEMSELVDFINHSNEKYSLLDKSQENFIPGEERREIADLYSKLILAHLEDLDDSDKFAHYAALYNFLFNVPQEINPDSIEQITKIYFALKQILISIKSNQVEGIDIFTLRAEMTHRFNDIICIWLDYLHYDFQEEKFFKVIEKSNVIKGYFPADHPESEVIHEQIKRLQSIVSLKFIFNS